VTETDKKGIFIVDFKQINVTYLYRFDKAGYQTSQVEQSWTLQGTARHEFKLAPGGPAVMEGPAPASTSNAAIVAYNAGAAALRGKEYPIAQAKFEEALKHDPKLRQAWEALSQAQLEQKRYPQAAEAAEKAIALGSTNPSVLRSRWEAYRNMGDAAKTLEAGADLERIGRLAEEAKRIHNEGVALSKAGNDQAAFAKFQQAVEADPNFEPALLALAVTGLKIDRPAESEAAAGKLLAGAPQHAEALRIRYNAALKTADEAKITEALSGLAAIDPTTARDGFAKIAINAFEADDLAKAKATFAKVLELDPNYARAYYHLGVIGVREGAKNEAKTHLKRFIQLAPSDPDVATAKGLLDHLGG
jgi:tetratricopeptide (TPR) repeat protein